jgi:hypothetical protein
MKFDLEMGRRKTREEEERLKGMTPKEREEWKRASARLSGTIRGNDRLAPTLKLPPFTGRQLFERDKHLEEDALIEEGGVSVDVSQYERERTAEDDDEDARITFSDSD